MDEQAQQITLSINGNAIVIDAREHHNLGAFLRNEMSLTGTKAGCANGDCGACNVLLDGAVSQSCQISLTAAAQCNVQTIESIVRSELGKKITDTLIKHDAAQCGYCLPGIVVAAYALLLEKNTSELEAGLQNNLCRCGSHRRILNALQEVAAVKDL